MLPVDEMGSELVGTARDQWGNPLSYDLKNNKRFLISSLGPDGVLYTVDDIHLTVVRNVQTEAEKQIAKSSGGDLFAAFHPDKSWLDRRREERGARDKNSENGEPQQETAAQDFSTNISIGGGEKLSGAAYFWFFAQLMLVTAFLFVLVAWFYQPHEYLQEEAAA